MSTGLFYVGDGEHLPPKTLLTVEVLDVSLIHSLPQPTGWRVNTCLEAAIPETDQLPMKCPDRKTELSKGRCLVRTILFLGNLNCRSEERAKQMVAGTESKDTQNTVHRSSE